MSSTLPDILVFMSDQHTPYYSGFYGLNVDTPNLDSLCREGVSFTECYTSNPLCGPARMSMLSGIRSAKNGIYHKGTLADTTPTFLYNLVEAGYESTLIGRMHFIGKEQNHGFMNHLAGDFTPVTWNYRASGNDIRKTRGIFAVNDTFSSKGASAISGGGDSPVLRYDEHVINTAIDYLSRPHDKPQCIFVSIYGPHFPYVAPKDLYLKYMERVQASSLLGDEVNCEVLKHLQSDVMEDVAKSCLAAYCGMIENVDFQFGLVKEAFEWFADQRGTEKIIGYTSDHGDQCGDRRIFGKETFYEKSVKIPLVLSGSGIVEDYTCTTPVSLMDLGPTLLEHTGCRSMGDIDGRSLAMALRGEQLEERPVISEFMYRMDGKGLFMLMDDATTFCHAFMIRMGDYKYVTYQGFETNDCLYNIKTDPDELCNLAADLPEELEKFRTLSSRLKLEELAHSNFGKQVRIDDLMCRFEEACGEPDKSMMWKGEPPYATELPEVCVLNQSIYMNKKKN